MRDLRKLRLIALLLSITSCICMFSVGFSTWYNVSNPVPHTKTVEVKTYDVLTIYMKGDNGMQIFKSSLLSFKTDADLADTDIGTIKINYVVPAATLQATGGSFKVKVSLGYDSLSSIAPTGHLLFTNAFDGHPDNTYSVTVAGKSPDANMLGIKKITNANGMACDAIELTKSFTAAEVGSLNTDFEFTVVYTFNIKSGINFKESFGQYLNGTEGATVTKFAASAEVLDVT